MYSRSSDSPDRGEALAPATEASRVSLPPRTALLSTFAAAAALIAVFVFAQSNNNTLRVCADPNNLPFSNIRGEGFENRLAELIARDMHSNVEYTWWAQRRGFVRNTLNAEQCDLVIGVPAGYDLLLTTRPYYRSSYVFVTRNGSGVSVHSMNDSALRNLRIGVQVVGEDYANTPPVHALSRRGIVDNVFGYSVYGNYAEQNPPARLIEALSSGDVDIAIAWGPMAGFFTSRTPERFTLAPVTPEVDLPFLPFVYDIAMGVRRADTTFRDRLNEILTSRRSEIDGILAEYGVPTVGARQVRVISAQLEGR
jgi:mxaJ protein